MAVETPAADDPRPASQPNVAASAHIAAVLAGGQHILSCLADWLRDQQSPPLYIDTSSQQSTIHVTTPLVPETSGRPNPHFQKHPPWARTHDHKVESLALYRLS